MISWNSLPLLASLVPATDEILLRPAAGPVSRSALQTLFDAILAATQLKHIPPTVFASAANNVTAGHRGGIVVANRATAIAFNLLPVATAGAGFAFFVLNRNTGLLTIDPNGAELINGAATLTVPTGGAALLLVENGEWRAFSFGGLPAADAAAYRQMTPGRVVTTDAIAGGLTPVALTDAATIAWDMSTGIHFTVTLGGNRTLGNPTNVTLNKSGRIEVRQDTSGSRTLGRGSNLKLAGGGSLVLSTAANAVDFLDYDVVAANFIRLMPSRGWA